MNEPESLRVLVLEDRRSDAELMVDELGRAGFAVDWGRVETPSDFLDRIEDDWDVILADYTLPQFEAPDALKLMQDRGIQTPFIVVTGSISEEVAVECMKQGAADYLLKDRMARLAPAVRQALQQRDLRRQKELAERERSRLVRILEATTDLVGIADPQWRGIYLNRAGREMLQLPEGASEGELDVRAFHPSKVWQDLVRSAIPRAIENGVWSGETEILARQGGTIPVLQVIIAHRGGDGELEFFSTIARDISDRKAYEQRIRDQVDRLHALRAIDLAITSSLDPRLTFNVLLEQLTSLLRVDAADILVFNPDSQTLNFAASRGFRTDALHHTHLRIGEGQAGRAVLERTHIHIPSLSDDPSSFARSPDLLAEGFEFYYAIPLIAKSQIKGVLELFHRSPMELDKDWTEFLETLAGQAAIAIDNTGLFDNLQQANIELIHAYDSTIEGWARALELRDIETEGHARRVTEMTIRLARGFGLSEGEISHVRRGALLHDIGKMAIPDSILLKPGPLTDEEWAIMKRHPGYAYELLSPITFLKPALDIPHCHHEKWDGMGYPRKLRGEEIPMSARIFAVVDVWDALTSRRPYRDAWPGERARAHIAEQAGTHFDPEVTEAFLRHVDDPTFRL